MEQLLPLFTILPLATFIVCLLLSSKQEKRIATVAIFSTILHLLFTLAFSFNWMYSGAPLLDTKFVTIFKTAYLEIFIDFFFDKVTVAYSLVGSAITLAVLTFSKTYMHREQGYKRFFVSVLFFYFGYNFVIYSGNFETLFIGWEVVGITSFLLIAFYYDRYLPVKNALKVISVYRLGDICLILAMWMSHHLWHENITFLKLSNLSLVSSHLQQNYGMAAFISLMLLMAAMVKSAQFPLSSWLPRAMEGPTTSSAIFYGSLSLHLGLFVLLRTYSYWEPVTEVRILVLLTGLSTAIVAALTAKLQSTVKTQIAYSSAAQIGLMFIEVALGFHTFALIHFAGNTFLRTYQLLVSPSVLSYSIHNMMFEFKKGKSVSPSSFVNTLYVISLKEWNMDFFQHRFIWAPFKQVGSWLGSVKAKTVIVMVVLLLVIEICCYAFLSSIPLSIIKWIPGLFSIMGFALVLISFADRSESIKAWTYIFLSHLFILFAIAISNSNLNFNHIMIYLSGVVVSGIVGYACLKKVKDIDKDIDLNKFHGYRYEQPVLALVFLLSCLAIVGLPLTPTFIGIDLLISNIDSRQFMVIVPVALSFLFMEIAALRIYSRIFLGQHKKHYHPIAYKSS